MQVVLRTELVLIVLTACRGGDDGKPHESAQSIYNSAEFRANQLTVGCDDAVGAALNKVPAARWKLKDTQPQGRLGVTRRRCDHVSGRQRGV